MIVLKMKQKLANCNQIFCILVGFTGALCLSGWCVNLMWNLRKTKLQQKQWFCVNISNSKWKSTANSVEIPVTLIRLRWEMCVCVCVRPLIKSTKWTFSLKNMNLYEFKRKNCVIVPSTTRRHEDFNKIKTHRHYATHIHAHQHRTSQHSTALHIAIEIEIEIANVNAITFTWTCEEHAWEWADV